MFHPFAGFLIFVSLVLISVALCLPPLISSIYIYKANKKKKKTYGSLIVALIYLLGFGVLLGAFFPKVSLANKFLILSFLVLWFSTALIVTIRAKSNRI